MNTRIPAALAALAAGLLVGGSCFSEPCDNYFVDLEVGGYVIARPDVLGMESGTITLDTVDDPVVIEYVEADSGATVTVTYSAAGE